MRGGGYRRGGKRACHCPVRSAYNGLRPFRSCGAAPAHLTGRDTAHAGPKVHSTDAAALNKAMNRVVEEGADTAQAVVRHTASLARRAKRGSSPRCGLYIRRTSLSGQSCGFLLKGATPCTCLRSCAAVTDLNNTEEGDDRCIVRRCEILRLSMVSSCPLWQASPSAMCRARRHPTLTFGCTSW